MIEKRLGEYRPAIVDVAAGVALVTIELNSSSNNNNNEYPARINGLL